MKLINLLVLSLFVTCSAMAQIKMPPASPTYEVKGTIGLAEVKLVYSRPSARGRVVAGNLIPYNEVWRTGANSSTKITFSDDVTIEGNAVPAGDYALYTNFNEKEATVILSKNLELWGSMGYSESNDQLRFTVPVKNTSSHYETFTMTFSDFTKNAANLNLKWEKTKITFKIENSVDDKVMADIKAQVIDATPENAGVYYQAATYYYDTERDAKQALEWVEKAISGSDKKQYWVVHLKAKILARMGKKAKAKEAAMESIELAKAGENLDYVRLNEKLIKSL